MTEADTANITFDLFGSVTARRGDHVLPLGPPRFRAVLGLLLLQPGRLMPTEQLVDELWGTDTPAKPVATLHTYVSHLRRRLAAVPSQTEPLTIIRYDNPGYVIEIDPACVDIHRFQKLVEGGRQHACAGRFAQAYADLAAGLALWRDPPFAGLLSIDRLAAEGARLEELRLAALETHAEAALRLGQPDAVVTMLTRETVHYPARERLVGRLMEALSRTGRQAEAIQLFERTRGYLADELGVYPGEELTSVQLSILRQEPSPVTYEAAVATEARRESVLLSEEGDSPIDAAPADEDGPQGVVAYPSLFGRSAEMSALSHAVDDGLHGAGHLVALVGEAGIGKSELLLQLTRALDASGRQVVRAQCRPGAGVPTCWLWAQVFRGLARLRPGFGMAARERFDGISHPLWSAPRKQSTAVTALETDRFVRHDVVCEMVLEAADDTPVVLVLEDVHWADRPSIELLAELRSRSHRHPIGIVVSMTTSGIGGMRVDTCAASELLADARTRTIELRGLPESAVGSLIAAHTGQTVNPDLRRVLHERSAGNPYFLVQLLSLLPTSRPTDTAEAIQAVCTEIPRGLREALSRAATGLAPEVLSALRSSAVLGPDVDLDVLSEIVDDAAVPSTIESGWLRHEPGMPGLARFRYEIVREYLLDEMPHTSRTDTHRRIAQVLLARGGIMGDQSERIAHHIWQADDSSGSGAVRHLLRAGRSALGRLAHADAEQWLRRGLALLARGEEDVRNPDLETALRSLLAMSLVTSRGWNDEVDAQYQRCQALRTKAQYDDFEMLQWARCCTYLASGHYEKCLVEGARLGFVTNSQGECVAATVTHYLTGVLLHIRGRFHEALTALDAAVEQSRGMPTRGRQQLAAVLDVRVACRAYRALTVCWLGDRQRAQRECNELLLLTEHGWAQANRAFALYTAAMIAVFQNDAATAARLSDDGLDLVSRFELPIWGGMLRVVRGWADTREKASRAAGIQMMRSAIADLTSAGVVIRNTLHLALLADSLRAAGLAQEEAAVRSRRAAEIRLRGEFGYSGQVPNFDDTDRSRALDLRPGLARNPELV